MMAEKEYNPGRLEIDWLKEDERRCSCKGGSRYSLCAIVAAVAVGVVIGIVSTLGAFYASHPTSGAGADSFCGTPIDFMDDDKNVKEIDCDSIRAENMSGSVQETINNFSHCMKCAPRLQIVPIPLGEEDNRLDNGGYFRPSVLLVPRCPNTTCFDDMGKVIGKCCPKKQTRKTFQYYVEDDQQKVQHPIDLEVHDSCVCKGTSSC